jgi:hypothetical protein
MQSMQSRFSRRIIAIPELGGLHHRYARPELPTSTETIGALSNIDRGRAFRVLHDCAGQICSTTVHFRSSMTDLRYLRLPLIDAQAEFRRAPPEFLSGTSPPRLRPA